MYVRSARTFDMTANEEHWRQRARTVIEQLTSDPDEADPAAADGFKIEDVGSGLLISRWDHALGLIRRNPDGFVFTHVANAEPAFRSTDVDILIDYLVDVVAAALRASLIERRQ